MCNLLKLFEWKLHYELTWLLLTLDIIDCHFRDASLGTVVLWAQSRLSFSFLVEIGERKSSAVDIKFVLSEFNYDERI